MITGKDFIFTGLQPWDITIGSNAKDIALEISKHNRVLYVNTPLDWKTYFSGENYPETIHRRKVVKKEIHFIRQINPNLWVLDYPFTIHPINELPDGKIFDWMNRFNNKKMYSFVKKTIEQLGFSPTILFCDNDPYRSFYAQEYLEPSLFIYYLRDRLSEVEYWKKHILRLEPLLIKKSSCVLCNSEQLAESARKHNIHSFNIGQGVDLTAYLNPSTLKEPDDISAIPHPRIGYMGEITSLRLDYNLIHDLAKEFPDVSFVFVGREDIQFQNHKVKNLKNIFCLGLKSPKSIPSYIKAFDICINPQAENKITEGNYPRKIDEYLALGKPVLATKTPAMNMFSEYCDTASGIQEYQRCLQYLLDKENSPNEEERRIRFAQTHTWTNNVKKIYDIIHELT